MKARHMGMVVDVRDHTGRSRCPCSEMLGTLSVLKESAAVLETVLLVSGLYAVPGSSLGDQIINTVAKIRSIEQLAK